MIFLLIIIMSIFGQSPGDRAKKLASNMTLEEQLLMVRGYSGPYVGNVASQPKHNIPELHLEDGPQGVADGVKGVTCWPNALAAASTWDVDLMETYAGALGNEQRQKGTNIMLGPMVNIARVPQGGRNFESMGEDPFLSSRMVERNIQGIQKEGVIGCVKHFLNNNQEEDRQTVSADVDERTEHEIYLPPFEAAIKNGKVGSVMCSYNKINGTHACENYGTLTRYLKEELGFTGFVMSDWGGTHSTVDSANNGLDMEMPSHQYFGALLSEAVKKGKVKKERIEDMVIRILTPMFQVGIMDTPQTGNLSVNVESKEHTELAQSVAEQSTVLLKNDEKSLLPIDISSKPIKIAVIGNDGNESPTVTGGGSGSVICSYVVSPLAGINNLCGRNCSSVEYANTIDVIKSRKIAKESDVAIVFVSTDSSEGHDRKTLGLGIEQDLLVDLIVHEQPNTVVVVHGPGAVLMPWEEKVPAILFGWLPGQQDGDAIANILFGNVNPSAKLPLTFPVSNDQTPLKTRKQYPGTGIPKKTEYSEKLLVGYRWYDDQKETPLYPFGHGLSYTSFKYSDLKISGQHLLVKGGKIQVSFQIENSGNMEGREVPQLYLGYPSDAGEPPKVLRGFQKIESLKPGDNTQVSFDVEWDGYTVGVWNTTINTWSVVPGSFDVYIGSSSRDIRLTGSFDVKI